MCEPLCWKRGVLSIFQDTSLEIFTGTFRHRRRKSELVYIVYCNELGALHSYRMLTRLRLQYRTMLRRHLAPRAYGSGTV
jgi:hypothetical protein